MCVPPNGAPGGCSVGATTGVTQDNQLDRRRGATIEYSPSYARRKNPMALQRYNYSQGHLMVFNSNGTYVGAYQFGWDMTPAIYRHDNTYSILLKENRYNTTSYCGTGACPPRNIATPNDPESYFITKLNASLNVEWKFQGTNTMSCERATSARALQRRSPGARICVKAIAAKQRRGVRESEAVSLRTIRKGGSCSGSSPGAGEATGRFLVPTAGFIRTGRKLLSSRGSPKRRAVKR